MTTLNLRSHNTEQKTSPQKIKSQVFKQSIREKLVSNFLVKYKFKFEDRATVSALVEQFQTTQELNQKTLKDLEIQIQNLYRNCKQASNAPQKIETPTLDKDTKQDNGGIQLPKVASVGKALKKVQDSRVSSRGGDQDFYNSFSNRHSSKIPLNDQELSQRKGSEQSNTISQGQFYNSLQPKQVYTNNQSPVDDQSSQSRFKYQTSSNSKTIYHDSDPFSRRYTQKSQNTYQTIRDKLSNGHEWLDVLQYQREKFEEEMRKKNQDKQQKIQQYKQYLDNSLQQKQSISKSMQREENQFVQKMLEEVKQGQQEEQFRVTSKKQKLFDLSKQLQQQAHSQRSQYQSYIEQEKQEQQEQLRNNSIQDYSDQQRRIQLRNARRSDILDQLKQNNQFKMSLQQKSSIEKREDLKMCEENDKIMEQRELIKRQQVQRRQSNVQHLMDTLGHRIKQSETSREQNYELWLQQNIDKFEERIKKVEQDRTQSKMQQREKFTKALIQQLQEREDKEREKSVEKVKLMDEMNQTVTQFKQQQERERQQKLQREIELKEEQRRQIEEKQNTIERMTQNGSFFNKRLVTDVAMNDQELLMNRKLLEEIRERRRKQGRIHVEEN